MIADNPKCWGGKTKPTWPAGDIWAILDGYVTYDDISELEEIAEHLDKDETRYR